MGIDLRKTFGIYKAEREARQSVKLFTDLLGIDPEHLIIDEISQKLSQIITKRDAANLAKILTKYAES